LKEEQHECADAVPSACLRLVVASFFFFFLLLILFIIVINCNWWSYRDCPCLRFITFYLRFCALIVVFSSLQWLFPCACIPSSSCAILLLLRSFCCFWIRVWFWS
jgi:hypothetical protein